MRDLDDNLIWESYSLNLLIESIKDYKNKKQKEGVSSRFLDDTIQLYKKLKSENKLKGKEKDIGYWMDKDVALLYHHLTNLPETKRQKKRKGEWDLNSLHEDAKLIRDNKYFTVLEIFSYEASRIYGSNTKWCIVADNGHWNEYVHDKVGHDEDGYPDDPNTVYYVLHKNIPKFRDDDDVDEDDPSVYKKLAFVYDGEQGDWTVWNSADDELDSQGFIDFYLSADPTPPINEQNNDLMDILDIIGYKIDVDYDTISPKQAKSYARKGIGDKDRLEDIIASDMIQSSYYFYETKKPFIKGEKSILKNFHNSLIYFNMFKDRLTSDNKEALKVKFEEMVKTEDRRTFLSSFFDHVKRLKSHDLFYFIFTEYLDKNIEVLYQYSKVFPQYMSPNLERRLFEEGTDEMLYYFIEYRTRGKGKLHDGLISMILDRILFSDEAYFGYFSKLVEKHLTKRLPEKYENRLRELSFTDNGSKDKDVWVTLWREYALKFDLSSKEFYGREI